MDRSAAVALTFAAGAGLAAQAPINAALGRDVGRIEAAAVSFAVGTAVLVAASLVASDRFARLGEHPVAWHYVAGGLLGAAYVTIALSTVRALGSAGMIAVLITGQLSLAAALDHFGLLGLERTSVTPLRLVGLALLVAGVVFVVRR